MGWDNEIQTKVYRHARDDLAANPGAPSMRGDAEPSTFLQWVRANHAKQPNVMGEIKAIIREAIKDIRQTVNQVFFGQHEHAPEAGTPLNPTPQAVTQDMGNFHGYSASKDAGRGQSYADLLNQTAARAGQDNDRGRGMSR
jgi:hypothetical protein